MPLRLQFLPYHSKICVKDAWLPEYFSRSDEACPDMMTFARRSLGIVVDASCGGCGDIGNEGGLREGTWLLRYSGRSTCFVDLSMRSSVARGARPGGLRKLKNMTDHYVLIQPNCDGDCSSTMALASINELL